MPVAVEEAGRSVGVINVRGKREVSVWVVW